MGIYSVFFFLFWPTVNCLPLPGISDFIGKCQQAIAKFESLVNQIQKNAKDINLRLKMMEDTDLFKYPIKNTSGGEYLPSAKVNVYVSPVLRSMSMLMSSQH